MAATLAAAALCFASPAQATPAAQPAAQDLGPTAAGDPITVSLVLKVRHPDLLEDFDRLVQEPNSFLYHRFLSVREFVLLFAPSNGDINTITKYLKGFGITVNEVYADHLIIKATGTADAFNQAFTTDMHDFQANGHRFHRPRHHPKIPLLIRDLLVAVEGLSDEPHFKSHHMRSAAATGAPPIRSAQSGPGVLATGQPGDFTVGDVANMYDINPLYDANIDGTGQTIGIVTLANFQPADAFAYWDMIGLDTDPDRITQVHVDGGGVLSARAGTGETSLDVEQSGGLAPGAKIVVYDSPNTDAGFLDGFYKAASDNIVDTLSSSWGQAEIFFLPDNQGEGDFTDELLAYHQAFLELGAQGISSFSSSGDNGAYDANDAFNDPFLNVLAVDHPSSDPAITSAGGTTTPVIIDFGVPGAPLLTVQTEQVWGWDYIQDYLVQFVDPSFQDALFPAGGGGGVSVFWPRPFYQDDTNGIRRSEPGQSIIFDDGSGSGPQDLLDLPAHFAGRNVPDVSLDGDPFTGFFYIATTDGGFNDGIGGTSFVAPQLNGISALLSQAAHGRVGFWNPMLYRFKRNLHGNQSPFVDITAGDNWFYHGVKGYEPGAGLGVLDVANLAAAVVAEGHHHH